MSIAMPAGVAESAFEVVAFQALPTDTGVAVLELRGRFTGSAPWRSDRARLRVERPSEAVELTALHSAGETAGAWSATFAVAVDALQDATFALAVARGTPGGVGVTGRWSSADDALGASWVGITR